MEDVATLADALIAQIAAISGETVSADQAVVSSGILTSMDVTRLEVWVERTYGVTFDLLTVNEADTPARFARLIAKKREQ